MKDKNTFDPKIYNSITKKRIEEYKEMHLQHFKVEISDQEALRQIIALLTLVKIAYKPISKKISSTEPVDNLGK